MLKVLQMLIQVLESSLPSLTTKIGGIPKFWWIAIYWEKLGGISYDHLSILSIEKTTKSLK